MKTPETIPTPDPTSQSVASPPKLLDRLRQQMRQRQWGVDQIDASVRCVAAFIQFQGLRHPRELGPEHVAAFLAQMRRDPETTPQREAAARAARKFLYEEFLPTDTSPPAPEQAKACTNQPGGTGPTASPFLNRCHEILRVRH